MGFIGKYPHKFFSYFLFRCSNFCALFHPQCFLLEEVEGGWAGSQDPKVKIPDVLFSCVKLSNSLYLWDPIFLHLYNSNKHLPFSCNLIFLRIDILDL